MEEKETNLKIPADLRASLEAVANQFDSSWSAVARQAIRYLVLVLRTKSYGTITDEINRGELSPISDRKAFLFPLRREPRAVPWNANVTWASLDKYFSDHSRRRVLDSLAALGDDPAITNEVITVIRMPEWQSLLFEWRRYAHESPLRNALETEDEVGSDDGTEVGTNSEKCPEKPTK